MSDLSSCTYMPRGVHNELPLDGPHAVLLVLRIELVACDHQGIHVADGTACKRTSVMSTVHYFLCSLSFIWYMMLEMSIILQTANNAPYDLGGDQNNTAYHEDAEQYPWVIGHGMSREVPTNYLELG